MIKLIFFFALAIFLPQIALSQKEMNNWFFGRNAGLNFSSGVPVTASGGKVNAAAASSSISDDKGNLLFYSDGVTVWNKNHQPMPNGTGLKGSLTGSQTVLITYHPGSSDLYYIFTVDKGGGPNGFQYSVVDMSLNGGMGDVDVAQKNIDFNLPAAEKLTAVKKKNGRDLWLIMHAYAPFEDAFFVFSIDCKVISIPRVFNIGSRISSPGNAAGYMKVSPDGKTLVSANFEGDFEIFDFDIENGTISNARVIPRSSGNNCGPYGVEFSPDSRLLYLTEAYTCTMPMYTIWQYKLDPDINTLINSKRPLDAGTGNLAGALQLGPDNKLYIAYSGAAYLGVINNPNIYGDGTGFVKEGLALQAPATSSTGLPNVIAGLQRNALPEDTTVCNGVPLVLKPGLQGSRYVWSNGSNLDSLVVTSSGKYWVEIRTANENGDICPVSDTINVSLKVGPVFNLGKDTLLCENKLPLLLAPKLPAATYLWQDGSVAATYTASKPGWYWLQATADGCSFRDSVEIKSTIPDAFSIGNDTAFCTGDSLKLTAGIAAAAYVWNTGSTANNIIIKAPGIYWCEATYSNGCSYRDSVTITQTSRPVFSLGRDTTLCQSQFPIVLNPGLTGASYLWQDNSTATSFTVAGPGSYWVKATVNGGCSATDSIVIKANTAVSFNLGADTVLCTGSSLTLTVNPAFTAYRWSTGSNAKSINVTSSGIYWSEAANSSGCSYRDTIVVTFTPSALVNLGKDTSVCSTAFPLTIGQVIPGASYLWQDGSTGPTYSVARPGIYSVQVSANGCSSKDSINIASNTQNSFSLGADTTICSQAPVTLRANVSASSYLWSTGSTAQSITVSNSGEYWCEINSSTGCSSRDTIKVTIAAPVSFSLGRDTVICGNAPLLLDVSNLGDSYSWQDNSNKPQYEVSRSGTYYVRVTRGNCVQSDTIVVRYSAQNLPALGPDKTICAGEEILLDANVSASAYLWQDGSRGRTFKVTTPGTYSVEVLGDCGRSTDVIVIGPGSCKLMIPNAFTPGKAPNAIFHVLNLNISDTRDFNFQVFSRWGQQVFQSNKPSEGWDGRYNGMDQPAGTYTYMVSFTETATGKKNVQKGTVVLVR